MDKELIEEAEREIERLFAADPVCGGRFCAGTAKAAAEAAYAIVRERMRELEDAIETLCDSVEREEELNASISATLMSDVSEARAALTKRDSHD